MALLVEKLEERELDVATVNATGLEVETERRMEKMVRQAVLASNCDSVLRTV